ncbi:hypothetical protein QQS21_010841 [Conoideocrella luteorostrata]|uniref:Uncharacterized protein n=1 Tax=Conoideocrella luteorostrata TaxID=1105319 RepID=A0AAJ0FWF8_9HYPO|nr:hypothetical protein QQS21_010841 [Conoideocrella luteorostrata]
MAYPPPRRSRYDDYDGYYGPPLDDRFTGPPPQKHKSEGRHRRRRSPDIIPPEDTYASRRGHSRREPPEPLGMTQSAGGRRARSPPPYYTSEPLPREPRRDGRREHRHSRRERDAPRDYSDRDYHPEPRESHRRSHRDDLEYRPRRAVASPPPDYSRSYGRDGPARRSHKSRPSSSEPRPRDRGYPSPVYGSDDEKPRRRARSNDRSYRAPPPIYRSDDEKPSHRAKSHDRPYKRAVSPARGRDRDIASHSSKSSSSRRKSAPAPQAPPATASKAKKQQWWQNPLVQAGARTAFSAGAQAAMQNRKDPSPWLGQKGAKVATAALGAALMDGFGKK